ncbi:MAG: rRNA maturation RNase YbeY [Bacteroidota bacterium]
MFNVPESHFLEEENVISFFSEGIPFELKQPDEVATWIAAVVKKEGGSVQSLSYIFCSDPYLHQLNLKYLNHDTLTDIITFPYSEFPTIEGDLFISIDRVSANAQKLHLPFKQELFRVIIHGVLHLCGYGDKSAADVKLMRQKEEEMLALTRGFGLSDQE